MDKKPPQTPEMKPFRANLDDKASPREDGNTGAGHHGMANRVRAATESGQEEARLDDPLESGVNTSFTRCLQLALLSSRETLHRSASGRTDR